MGLGIFFIYICIPVCLFFMIVKYDNKRSNLMSSLKRKEFLEKIKKNGEDLRKENDIYSDNPWRKFEKEVANCFENNGREVELGPGSNDGGKDIVIRKGLQVYLVQCKHYYGNKFVSPKHVRDFQGAIDLYEKQNNMKVGGIFITSGKTTYQARETANVLGINLWDKWNWRDKIAYF